MAVIRQFPDNSGCSVCSSLVDLPHRDLTDCRNALAKEMDALLERAQTIANTRQALAKQRIQELTDLHGKPPEKDAQEG